MVRHVVEGQPLHQILVTAVLNVVTLTSVAKQIVDMSRNLTMIERSLIILMGGRRRVVGGSSGDRKSVV